MVKSRISNVAINPRQFYFQKEHLSNKITIRKINQDHEIDIQVGQLLCEQVMNPYPKYSRAINLVHLRTDRKPASLHERSYVLRNLWGVQLGFRLIVFSELFLFKYSIRQRMSACWIQGHLAMFSRFFKRSYFDIYIFVSNTRLYFRRSTLQQIGVYRYLPTLIMRKTLGRISLFQSSARDRLVTVSKS